MKKPDKKCKKMLPWIHVHHSTIIITTNNTPNTFTSPVRSNADSATGTGWEVTILLHKGNNSEPVAVEDAKNNNKHSVDVHPILASHDF